MPKCKDLDINFLSDDELQLAQGNKSSEDLFSTQESDKPNLVVAALTKTSEDNASTDLGTQTFSILDSLGANQTLDLNSQNKTAVCRTQTIGDVSVMSRIIIRFLDSFVSLSQLKLVFI